MDSLLANYASSDDEDQQPSALSPPAKSVNSDSKTSIPPKSTSQRGGIFNSLPPPKSSLFNSLPPPKSKPFPNPNHQSELEHDKTVESPKPKSSSSSLFSSLPPPKPSSSSSAASKKVVQFRPPMIVNPTAGSFNDEDSDSDEGEQERRRKKSKESISTASATSFLSSIPAPRFSATLGSASGRRSMLETDIPASAVSVAGPTGGDSVANTDQSTEIYDHSSSLDGESSGYYGYYGDGGSTDAGGVGTAGIDAGVNYNVGPGEGVDYSYGNGEHVEYTNYGGGYGDYGNNAQYENNWVDTTVLPEVSGVVETAFKMPGKRGRKDVPLQIVEVKQDELMKNRPREDQVKTTGIAFGPAYQPVSTKGKPTKLHKRKHQISSLYFDMKQKEAELAERRSKGFLTKAQTQAKYGW
ncbi:hypothetical protein PHJA_002014900 [Phtheirospermum japonicum]|uniref:Proline-rich protein PRCC n=1 Tax=Phtheirospermum japonicum TaxID=374723 RepID=A0A830CG96_9LAMI|nr:hypothetical protein PHJA_002014900 [Phtheirospermum japonicum]